MNIAFIIGSLVLSTAALYKNFNSATFAACLCSQNDAAV